MYPVISPLTLGNKRWRRDWLLSKTRSTRLCLTAAPAGGTTESRSLGSRRLTGENISLASPTPPPTPHPTKNTLDWHSSGCWTVNVSVLSSNSRISTAFYSSAAKPWARTGRSAGSIGSRCGGWSRKWRRWRRASSRARITAPLEMPRSGGGRKQCCDPESLHKYLSTPARG